jgi:hypothetical protein
MEDLSSGSSKIALRQKIQTYYYYRKPNVQEGKQKVFFRAARRAGTSSFRTLLGRQED